MLTRSLDFLFGNPRIGGELGRRLSAWHRRSPGDLGLQHVSTRYVVVDVETTGLDLRHDNVIAIGAVAVDGGVIVFDDAFEAVLRQPRASEDANILIHGIGGQMQLAGRDPALTLVEFLEYAGSAPWVAFRAEFDKTMLGRAMDDVLAIRLRVPFVDLALILPALFPGTSCDSLDEWLGHFGAGAADRHQAVSDAYATAQLFLIALAAADRVGMRRAADLIAMQKAQRWLGTRR